MNQRGVALLPVLLIIGAVFLVGGAFFLNSRVNQPVNHSNEEMASSTPEPTADSSTSASPVSKSSSTVIGTPTPKSTCNSSKDVCFDMVSPNVIINEGSLEDANYWVSDQLMLTGKGSGGYEVSIAGFPKEFSVRFVDQSFADGGKGRIYLRAQKNVAKKGTYSGTISVKSYITNVTTTANLSLTYADSNNIHTSPSQVTLDCTIKYDVNYTNSRQLDCGKYEDHSLQFYAFKNDKTIEIRTNPETSTDKGITLDMGYTHTKTLSAGQDVYTLHFDPKGIDYNNLNSEPDGTYKGYFSFVDQSSQKELLHIPYTLTIHAYKQ